MNFGNDSRNDCPVLQKKASPHGSSRRLNGNERRSGDVTTHDQVLNRLSAVHQVAKQPLRFNAHALRLSPGDRDQLIAPVSDPPPDWLTG